MDITVFIFLKLLCWVEVHWSIYKGSYNVPNISYLNSSPTLLFYHPSPDSWNSFNRYHFYVHLHVYTFFAPYSSSSFCQCYLPLPLVPTAHLSMPTPTSRQKPVPPSCSLILWKKKNMKDKRETWCFC
jgi:hypothetical protein